MPPKKAKAATGVKVKRVIPHCQISGSKVVYLQLDRRPPDSVLEILRGFGHYRRGPDGAGWHIGVKQARDCSRALSKVWKPLADAILDCARFVQKHPEKVPCPSQNGQLKPKYTGVQKLG